jgi:hypothetical protein
MLPDTNRRQRTGLDESVHGHRRDPNVVGNFANREQVMICAHVFTSDPQSTRHNPFGINGRSMHQPDIGTTWAGVEHFVGSRSETASPLVAPASRLAIRPCSAGYMPRYRSMIG